MIVDYNRWYLFFSKHKEKFEKLVIPFLKYISLNDHSNTKNFSIYLGLLSFMSLLIGIISLITGLHHDEKRVLGVSCLMSFGFLDLIYCCLLIYFPDCGYNYVLKKIMNYPFIIFIISCLGYYIFTLIFWICISLLANTDIITYIFLSLLTLVLIYVIFLQYKNNKKPKTNGVEIYNFVEDNEKEELVINEPILPSTKDNEKEVNELVLLSVKNMEKSSFSIDGMPFLEE